MYIQEFQIYEIVHTMMSHQHTVLWIAYNAYLTIRMLWFTIFTAYIFRQLPQSTTFLQIIARKIKRCQHLINAPFVGANTKYHHFCCKFIQKTTNCSCKRNSVIQLICSDSQVRYLEEFSVLFFGIYT